MVGDRRIEVGPDPMVIGRRDDITGTVPDVDLTAADPDHHVSRRHLRLRLVDGAVEVTDLASKSGTLVNQDPLPPETPILLMDRTSILLGNLRILLDVERDINEALRVGQVVDERTAGKEVEEGTILW